MESKKSYKVKRLRDGEVLKLDPTHALNLLRLNAKQTKSEFDLVEPNYSFSKNEIHRNPKSSDTEKPEGKGENK